MTDITGLLADANLLAYTRQIEIGQPWCAYKDPQYPVNEASCREQRLNRSGDAAFYIASGEETAKANVPSWPSLTKYDVAPQVVTCFDLPAFAQDHGLEAEFSRPRESGGYPFPQATADLLLKRYGFTGIVYNSVADSGKCLVLRPESGKMIGDQFFVVSALSQSGRAS